MKTQKSKLLWLPTEIVRSSGPNDLNTILKFQFNFRKVIWGGMTGFLGNVSIPQCRLSNYIYDWRITHHDHMIISNVKNISWVRRICIYILSTFWITLYSKFLLVFIIYILFSFWYLSIYALLGYLWILLWLKPADAIVPNQIYYLPVIMLMF